MTRRRRALFGRRGHHPSLLQTVAVPARAEDGEAEYVGTMVGGSQHHRMAGGVLFGRGRCRYWLEPGRLLVQRPDGPVLALDDVSQVGLVGAYAGVVLAPNRIAIVTWTLGYEEADTGFGFDYPNQAERFAELLAEAAGLSPDRGPHAGA